MVIYNGAKYSCETCLRGHRGAKCSHEDRTLHLIRRKGRPSLCRPESLQPFEAISAVSATLDSNKPEHVPPGRRFMFQNSTPCTSVGHKKCGCSNGIANREVADRATLPSLTTRTSSCEAAAEKLTAARKPSSHCCSKRSSVPSCTPAASVALCSRFDGMSDVSSWLAADDDTQLAPQYADLDPIIKCEEVEETNAGDRPAQATFSAIRNSQAILPTADILAMHGIHRDACATQGVECCCGDDCQCIGCATHRNNTATQRAESLARLENLECGYDLTTEPQRFPEWLESNGYMWQMDAEAWDDAV